MHQGEMEHLAGLHTSPSLPMTIPMFYWTLDPPISDQYLCATCDNIQAWMVSVKFTLWALHSTDPTVIHTLQPILCLEEKIGCEFFTVNLHPCSAIRQDAFSTNEESSLPEGAC